MERSLAAEVCDRVACVDAQVWGELFPSHPDSYELIRLIEQCGMDGFRFSSIVVRQNGRPILLMPLFEKRFDASALTAGITRRLASVFGRVLPGLLRPKILGVGFVEGEWGEVGVRRDLPPESAAAAWRVGLDALTAHRAAVGADVLLWLSFTPESAAHASEALGRCAKLPTYPCGRLAVNCRSVDDYLASLSSAMRKDIRRKLRVSDRIEIIRPASAGEHLDAIHSLYMTAVQNAEMSLGIHRREFFDQVCGQVPGAQFVLYRAGGRLIAFNLLIEHGGALVDKYFCMEPGAGREHNLYFVSWIENVRWCIERGIGVYHAGPGAEATKARLGARFVPSLTFFRHSNPLAHGVLSRLKGLMAYKPAVDLSRPEMLDGPTPAAIRKAAAA